MLQPLSEGPEGKGVSPAWAELVPEEPPCLSPSSRVQFSAEHPDLTFSSLLPSAPAMFRSFPGAGDMKPRQRWLFFGVTAWARKEVKAAHGSQVWE